jgi:uncharacterized protein (TIGR04255 family)
MQSVRQVRHQPVPKTPRRPPELPNFNHPPVSEVVLSIQFAALPTMRSVHAGLYWKEIRKQYPKPSEQAPIAPAFETFGGTPTPAQTFQIQTLLVPPMPRHWFETERGEHLLQLQPDRIIHNWRQRNPEMPYPRYELIRRQFASEVAKLEALFRKERVGEIRPNHCEVTYINTISLPDGLNPHHHLDRITPLWTSKVSEPFAPELENATIQTRYILKRQDSPYGRVYVSFIPAFLVTNSSPVIQLEVTAKGRPQAESVSAAFDLLDEERDVVVRTFTAVTTPAMHQQWGRTDAP